MFTTENTTHEEAVRILKDRETKNTDLYNSLGATQAENRHLRNLLQALTHDATSGKIAQYMRCNPFSIKSIKEADKFLTK